MATIQLVKPTKEHEAAMLDYLQEHRSLGEHVLHGASLFEKMESYDAWLQHLSDLSDESTVGENWVQATTFLAVEENDQRVVGILDVRHYLNEVLLNYGGHIGYGVRPSERRKGYASQILYLALDYCKTLNLEKVMVACEKSNLASAKTIQKNGGLLTREFIHSDGKAVQIYWITLTNKN